MDKQLYLIKEGKLYGFINNHGEIEIEPIYKNVHEFNDGVAMVTTVDDKSYIIDTDNNIVLKLNSNKYVKFENGLVQIRKDNKVGFIDKSGKWVIEPKFDMVLRGFNEAGFAIVEINRKYGTIDKQGNFIIEPNYLGIGRYSEGTMSATNDEGKEGLIDKNGNIVIDFKFDSIDAFFQDVASFKKFHKCGFINVAGDVVIEPRYHAVWEFRNGLCAFTLDSDSPFGFINKNGEVVIKNKYQNVGSFHEGLARFTNDDLEGYLNTNGEEVIRNVFATADDFKNGLALVTTLDNEWGYINTDCEWVYKPKNFNLW